MPKKILLVDNDKFFREFLSELLTEEGYEVETTSDGIEVIEKIDTIKPNAIVLDLVMENFDGDQVIKFLKRNKAYKNLPIIVLSGILSEDPSHAKKLDADIFIPKSNKQTMKKELLKNLEKIFKKTLKPKTEKTKKEKPSKDIQDGIIAELLNKSKTLQNILENLSDGILVADENHRIIFANAGLQKMLELKPENILGKNLKELLAVANARPKIIEDTIKNVKTGDKPKISELFYGGKVLKMKVSYFTTHLDLPATFIAFSDMTEQKTIQAKFETEYTKRTEELEKTYKELQKMNVELVKAGEIKSQFVANVSHELRSPLNDIMGFVQLLQAKIYGSTTPKQDEALRHIMQNSNSLLKMINEILDVTKLDKQEMPVITNKIHPRELIEQVIGGYSWIGEVKDLDIQVFYPDKLHQIETDDTKLKRILLNLLDNAVKFTEHGHIYFKVEDHPEEEKIEFVVEDTGLGMSEEVKELIFEPFRQIDGSSTRQHGGVGLGLYIVKKLVLMLNGSISLESIPGEGSTFRVKIPYTFKEGA